jgi:tetratricopeptide (TPR) repeat protein
VLRYRNFEVEIGPVRAEGYPIALLNSPGGQARGILALPDDLDLFERELAQLDAAMLAEPAADVVELAQHVGGQLFAALLPEELRSLYDVSRSLTREAGEGLRIKLRVNAPELTTLPWEFLYDSRRGAFVALSRHTPLVRYTEVATSDQPLAVTPPLRVLAIASSPDGVEMLDLEAERRRVGAALEPLVEQGLLSLTWLTPPTWRALQAALQDGPWHVLHFVGHAELDEDSGEGAIVLADDGGEALRLRADQLADLLADQRSLRLAILNACEGARGDGSSLYSSMAATLVQRGMPAVVAMQHAITDTAAIEFSGSFYTALANLYPVDAALAEARKAMSLAEPDSLEWATPVLHLRAPDGMLFVPDPVEEEQSQGGGNVFNIGSMGDGATVIGGDAENVVIGGSDNAAARVPDEGKRAETVRRGWFGRLFGRKQQGEESPKLVIGGDARNVIVDSRIMQFNLDGRRITVPIFIIAGVLVLMLALFLYPILKPRWDPTQMTGQFNIAVADFGEIDEQGGVSETNASQQLSEWLYEGLAAAYAETPDVPLADSVEIWHNSRTDSAQDITLHAIKGETTEARTKNAAALAERIGAHMVIYGDLVQSGEDPGLDLEFYVGSKVGDETAAIVGPHRLGQPVDLPVPFDGGDPTINEFVKNRLQTRTAALFWLTVGLTEEQLGRSEEALATFRRGEAALENWAPEEGKELLYFFIGREELFLGNDVAAEEAFQQALSINPNYARAHNGLGSVYFSRVQAIPPQERLAEPDAFTKVRRPYQTALQLARQQGNPLVEHLARLSLGMTGRLEGESYYVAQELEPALETFARAQGDLEEALDYFTETRHHRLTAQAYESLGLLHFQRSDLYRTLGESEKRLTELTAAQDAFANCLAEAEAGIFDELLHERIGEQSCARFGEAVDSTLAEISKETS